MLFGRKKRRITRILIAEDEPLVAFDTEHFLGEAGFEVVATVDRASDAIAVLSNGREVDLVLADLELTEGNGIDVAHAARERDVLVLFVTGNCPTGARELAAGCLGKPYPQRDLIAAINAIEKMLDGRPPKRLPPSFHLFERVAEA